MRNGFGPGAGKSAAVILTVIAAMLFDIGSAAISVEAGHSIQSAINASSPGQTIEVQNGTFNERINVTKPLVLKGMGRPIIDAGGMGSAITISANGSTLLGFTATGSGRNAEDASIKVISDGNIIKGNNAVNNSNCGIILYYADKNTVFGNTATGNQNGGFLLIHSDNNQIWGNYAGMNRDGISVQTSRGNTINANNLTKNNVGINISNNNLSESITSRGKGVSIKYSSSSQLTTYNIDKNSTSSSPGDNILYQNNLLDNGQSAFDDGHNQWYNDTSGNHYSDYDAREHGCKDRNRDRICDSGYSVPGGDNVDLLPQASSEAVLSYKSGGLMGSELRMDRKTYLPGGDIDVKYTVQENFSGWVGVMKGDRPVGNAWQDAALSYGNIDGPSGILKLTAPAQNGSYDLRLYNSNSNSNFDSSGSEEMASLSFSVAVPAIDAIPDSVNTCEPITVSYSGVPGYENDWVGMYRSGSPDTDYIARQYLDGNVNGNMVFDAADPGSYEFRIFENDSYALLASSNSLDVNEFRGTKVVASPTHVAPGGTVTVTYWGAPSSGTGIIGMYGMNRPDKFPLQKRSLGSKNCGRMTWKLPNSPGQYDFRMFYSDITSEGQGAYQLLGQSDVVTVS